MKNSIMTFGTLISLSTLSNAAVYSFLNQAATFDGNTSAVVSITDGSEIAMMTVASTGGNLNSNASGLGVGDANLDTGETITISFDKDVEINFLDLGGVGSNTADGANLKFGSAAAFDVFTGQPNFNGSSDVYTPATPIMLTSGDSIVIQPSSATASFDLDEIGVTVPPVPEPSSTLLLGLGSLAWLARRRK